MPMATTAARNAPAADRIAKLGPAPQTIEEALASQEARHWQQAVDKEISNLSSKGVWTPTTIAPGIKPVGSRWLFQRTPTPQGIEYRARVVAKGSDLPSDGVTGKAAMSGPSIALLRFLLAYAHDNELYVTHFRVEDPCLTVDLNDPIVLAVPPRHQVMGSNAYILTKTLHGLKNAPSAGLQALRDGLEVAGLQPISTEPNLLVADDVDMDIEFYDTAIAMTYAGGVVVAGPSGYDYEVLEALRRSGLTATRGPRDLILGLTIRLDPPDCTGEFIVSQPHYVDRVIQRFSKTFLGPTPPSPVPTQDLKAALRAFAGCLSWLASTTHMRWAPQVSRLSSMAQQQLTPDEWADAWEEAYGQLIRLQDEDERNYELRIRHTAIDDAP